MTDLMTLPADWDGMPAAFIEGALLAANANPKPLVPEAWLPVLINGGVVEEDQKDVTDEQKKAILSHFQMQYQYIKAGEYELPKSVAWNAEDGVSESLGHFAEGFLSVWPQIEPNWADQAISDGTMRMLSALITTMMLLLDEEDTLAQMKEAGITSLPVPSDLYPQVSLMIGEVVMAADEMQQGACAQAVNPYKETGRNDACMCNSGKKFKQCCGK